MERKLKPTDDLLEIGIVFSSIKDALKFVTELIENANQELPENPCWPTSIYWEDKEVHFYVDHYMWVTASSYMNTFEEPKAVYFQGFPPPDTEKTITPEKYIQLIESTKEQYNGILAQKKSYIEKLLAYYGFKLGDKIRFKNWTNDKGEIPHYTEGQNGFILTGAQIRGNKVMASYYKNFYNTAKYITIPDNNGFICDFDQIEPIKPIDL